MFMCSVGVMRRDETSGNGTRHLLPRDELSVCTVLEHMQGRAPETKKRKKRRKEVASLRSSGAGLHFLD